MVATALNDEKTWENEENQELYKSFKKRNLAVCINTGEDFSSFTTVCRDTEPEIKVGLDWMSNILGSSPNFSGEVLEKIITELKDGLKEDFTWDEEKRKDFIQHVTSDGDHPYSNKYFGIEGTYVVY